MRTINSLLPPFLMFIVMSPAVAERATGAVAAAACVSCHGEHGEGNAEIGIPKLAGLPPEYFVKQIEDFKAGRRTSPVHLPESERLSNAEVLRSDDPKAIADFYARWMVGVAKGISLEDAEAAAQYYAKQDRGSTPLPAGAQETGSSAAATGSETHVSAVNETSEAEVLALGEELAVNGDWERGIPACFKCHAEGAVGVGPAFPPLAGQHPDYIARQIKAWKTGTRRNDPLDLMKRLAENITDDEIHAVAAYLASLEPPEKAP